MNIAINLINTKTGAGISVYRNLFPYLDELDNKNKYFIFLSENQEKITNYIPDGFKKIFFKKIPSNPYFRILWEQIVLPFYIFKYKIDLLYSVGNTTVLLAPCKVLLFIENTNPFTKVKANWSLKQKIRLKLLYYLGYLSTLKANKIRFCSNKSMNIISKIYKINPNKCIVIYHGLDFNLINNAIDKKSNLNFNYILNVSVVAPHKNIEVLINAFALLKREGFYNGKLLIIGNVEAYRDYYIKLVTLSKKMGVENDVVFLGEVKYEDMFNYYENADVFIFPSLEETFGLPLIEAMYTGIPVIASDGNLHQELFIPFNELAEDKIVYFDPFSPEDLKKKVEVVLNSNKKNVTNTREYVIKKFSIEKVTKQLINIFNEMEL